MRARFEAIVLGVLGAMFYSLILFHAVTMANGCAHAKAVVKTCVALPSDVDLVLGALQSDGWQAALEKMAIDKTLCVVNAAVDQVIRALSQATSAKAILRGADDTLSRARAWRQMHP